MIHVSAMTPLVRIRFSATQKPVENKKGLPPDAFSKVTPDKDMVRHLGDLLSPGNMLNPILQARFAVHWASNPQKAYSTLGRIVMDTLQTMNDPIFYAHGKPPDATWKSSELKKYLQLLARLNTWEWGPDKQPRIMQEIQPQPERLSSNPETPTLFTEARAIQLKVEGGVFHDLFRFIQQHAYPEFMGTLHKFQPLALPSPKPPVRVLTKSDELLD